MRSKKTKEVLRGGWLLFLLLAIGLSLIMNAHWSRLPDNVQVASIAVHDIKADKDYEIVDEEETKALQEKASGEVAPVILSVKRGESIIRSGDRFRPWHAKVINGIRKIQSRQDFKIRLVGSFLLALFILTALFVFGGLFVKGFKPVRKDLVFCGLLLAISLLVVKSSFAVATGLQTSLPFTLPVTAFYYALPIAFGAMLVRLVLTTEIALFFAMAACLFAGVEMENDFLYFVYCFFSSLAGIVLIGHARSRMDIFKAGVWTGLVSACFVFVLHLVGLSSAIQPLIQWDIVSDMGAALFGGIVSSILVFVLTPLAESIFGYLTDVKLLELGSLNHPVLQELIVRAPGTYHHSHMVGTLAEAAAEAIGANGLFARVASYFHDIGKMKKSEYFIENQPPDENRHEKLAPSMSALIISSHVKEGIDMAREYKLPERIVDIIPQHQGTKLISYFYSRAKEAGQDLANEKDYRYPGPKPQTREAGIILLADTAEASTRSLKDRSPARIEEVVRNMINKNFIDGQLDECELTLQDLNLIAQSFNRILIGIYHKRIEYPTIPEEETILPPEHATDKYTKSKPLAEGPGTPGKTGGGATLRRIGPR
ncbi:MAG: HDIG domain-containing protein [Deltaproteobacteria bacterium]|nr:HDIG domain-containing protein [Deltaproteobacteria bacterium]